MASSFSTGGAAAVLQVLEPRLAELVRRGKIVPAPRVVAGRRIWHVEHVLQAARALGRDPDEVLRRLTAEVSP